MLNQVDTQNYVPLLKDIRDQLDRGGVSYSRTSLDYTVRPGAGMRYQDVVDGLTSLQGRFTKGSAEFLLIDSLISRSREFESTARARQLVQDQENHEFAQAQAGDRGQPASAEATTFDDEYEEVPVAGDV